MELRSLSPLSWLKQTPSRRAEAGHRPGRSDIALAARAAVESLETRVLFAAITVTATPTLEITASGSPLEEIQLTYVDPSGDVMTGFAAGNITVTGPAAMTVNSNVTVTQTSPAPGESIATAVYAVSPTSGTNFDSSDNGTYEIAINPGVTDAASDTVAGQSSFVSFVVAIPPTASVTPPNTITSGSTNTTDVIVTYDSDGGTINASTINTSNITVKNASGTALTIASISPGSFTNGPSEVVTYTVDAPGGGNWATADDGTYTIGVVGNVADTSGNDVAANTTAATFNVNVTDAPVATLTPTTSITTVGGNTESIVVTYSDPGSVLSPAVLINGGSIATNNLTIVSPNSTPITITAVSPSAPSNGSPLVVTYTASLPHGDTWNAALNGTYTIELNSTVKNTHGTSIVPVADFGTFTVNTPNTLAPTVYLSLAAPVLDPFNDQGTVIVSYYSPGGISLDSVNSAGDNAISVTNSSTGETLPVVSFTTSASANANLIQVTYTVQQPDTNNFSAADNGTYTIQYLGSPAITDVNGRPVAAATLGNLLVDIGNTVRPTATVTVADPTITTTGISGNTITFVITASDAINLSTITLDSLSVLGSNGTSLKPASLSLSPSNGNSTVTAVYTVAGPNGQFQGVDSGIYYVSLNGVADESGLTVLPISTQASFIVEIASPQNTQFMGQFGIFNGKEHKLHFYDVPAGTYITVTALGGQGGVVEDGDGSLNITLNDTGGGLTVKLSTNNARPVDLASVITTGTIDNFIGNNCNLTGVFQVSGNILKMSLRQIVGQVNTTYGTLGQPYIPATQTTAAIPAAVNLTGTLVASGGINNLRVYRAVTDAQILSGVSFGADGVFGTNPNTLIDDDTYGPGFIGDIVVNGSFTESVVAAGAAPGSDGVFGYNESTETDDDVRAGTAVSPIESIKAGEADVVTRFECGQFGTVKFAGQRITQPNPSLDNRFKGL